MGLNDMGLNEQVDAVMVKYGIAKASTACKAIKIAAQKGITVDEEMAYRARFYRIHHKHRNLIEHLHRDFGIEYEVSIGWLNDARNRNERFEEYLDQIGVLVFVGPPKPQVAPNKAKSHSFEYHILVDGKWMSSMNIQVAAAYSRSR